MVKSEQAVTVEFTTANPATGAAQNADSLPTAVLTVDGTDNAAAVTVTDVGTGRYKAAVTLPALTAGQLVAIVVSATVNSVAGAGVVWQDVADTARVSDVTAKTNNLPSDPADQSLLEAAIAAATVDFTPVLAAIAALPDGTDVAALDALLDAIKAKTDTIGSGSVTVVSPVADSGAVTLYVGDDYAVSHGRGLQFLVADSTHALGLDDVGAVVKFKCKQATWTASSVEETDAGYTVTFEPTATQTAALTIQVQNYELEAVLAEADVVTLATGTLYAVRDAATG